MKVLILGSNGMLGHVVNIYLTDKGHQVFATSRDKNNKYYFDAAKDINGIKEIISKVKPKIIINCIGILNNQAEENHDLAVLVNSYLPQYLAKISNDYGFKLIHISTDCVFEGTKGGYQENSLRDATSFYGRSKALGEVEDDKNLTLRTSIIGPDSNLNGIGLFQWFIGQSGTVKGYSKAIWTGVTSIELAKQILVAIENNLIGLQHVVNNQKISKYDLLNLINKEFKLGIKLEENPNYICDKSLIRTDASFDFKIPSYAVMIKEMKEWIKKYPSVISINIVKR